MQDTFATGDLFINIDDQDSAKKLIDRFLEGIFGANTISPTRDEYGIYLARNAALRSLDLSRQVGAAILTPDGEPVTTGCNEVPKALGGSYWTMDANDARDFKRETDPNEQIKRSLLVDFAKQLRANGYLHESFVDDDAVTDLVVKETARRGSLRGVQLMDLLEFGRIIHAEMSALCDAARLGRAVKNMTLFCTTFPCHICAKHIIAAGIKRVVFIEPYPKSYAEQLHNDAISIGRPADDKVVFEPFIGISPSQYRDIFYRGSRKDGTGRFQEWIGGKGPHPIFQSTIATYLENEKAITKIFTDTASKLVEEKKISIA